MKLFGLVNGFQFQNSGSATLHGDDVETMTQQSDDTQESPIDKDCENEEHLYTNLPWIKVLKAIIVLICCDLLPSSVFC